MAKGTIEYGNLDTEAASIDQALYVASCFCGTRGPQIIYSSTHPSVAAPETGERYLIFSESDTTQRHLRGEEGWEKVYRLERL
jgi:hypothetical protein